MRGLLAGEQVGGKLFPFGGLMRNAAFFVISLTLSGISVEAGAYSDEDAPSSELANHTIGGTVSGLYGSGFALSLNNNEQTLPVVSNGQFTFANGLAEGSGYWVTVNAQPEGPSQLCGVTRGGGVVGATNVSDVAVTCTTTHKIGGTVTGLIPNASAVELQLNGNETTPGINGVFIFPVELMGEGSYSVAVRTQPSGQFGTCNVTNGFGFFTAAMGDVTNIAVHCDSDRIFFGHFDY